MFWQGGFLPDRLDEHGQKVQQAAEATGQDAQTYCDGLAQDWLSFVEKLGISNNDFVRTTDARHKAVVAEVLQQLYDKGEFYQDEYVGFYSAKQETFLTEKDRNEDGEFDPIYGEVQELREKTITSSSANISNGSLITSRPIRILSRPIIAATRCSVF